MSHFPHDLFRALSPSTAPCTYGKDIQAGNTAVYTRENKIK